VNQQRNSSANRVYAAKEWKPEKIVRIIGLAERIEYSNCVCNRKDIVAEK